VAFDDDGTRIYSGSSHVIRVWNVHGDPDAELIALGDEAGPMYSLSFSPQGDAIAHADKTHAIRIWDRKTRQCRNVFAGHQQSVQCVVYSPDGALIASGSDDRTIRIWEARGAASAAPAPTVLGARSWAHQFDVADHGRHVIAGNWVWDTTTGLGRELSCVRSTGPDGWGPEQWYHPIATGRTAGSDHWYVAAVLDDRTVRTFESDTAKQVVTVARLEREPSFIRFSPRGATIAVIDDKTVTIWSAYAAPDPLGVLSGHEAEIHDLAWSLDGKRVATASSDRTVRVWEDSTGTMLHVLRGHERDVVAVAFSRDGERLASGDLSGVIRVWDLATVQSITVLESPRRGAEALAFSADGQRIFSRDAEEAVHEFDVATQTLVRTFAGVWDVAALSSGNPVFARRTGLESSFLARDGQQEVGWYSEPLKSLRGTGLDRTWAGLSGTRIHLVKLETETETEPAARTSGG
jgi:WD40 repeat protein